MIDIPFLAKDWKSKTPRKIQIFCVRMLLNRLPTKCQLLCRVILFESSYLARLLCSSINEDVLHIFYSCALNNVIWIKVCVWLCINRLGLATTLEDHFELFSSSLSKVYMKQFACFFWSCVCWFIWLWRDLSIFKPDEVMGWVCLKNIKRLSWDWFQVYFIFSSLVRWGD